MPTEKTNTNNNYQYLNPKHPGVEKFYPLFLGVEGLNFKSSNVNIDSSVKELSGRKNTILLFYSNHEGHVDYVVQEVELAREGITLPLVGAREKLHEDLLYSNSLTKREILERALQHRKHALDSNEPETPQNGVGLKWAVGRYLDRLALPIYEHHAYNIPKGEGKDILFKMMDIEKKLLDDGISYLKYPGGGLTKNGTPREFGRLSFKVAVEYLLSLSQSGKKLPAIYIVPSSISQEIVPDFGYYGDVSASTNPDEGRWKEIQKHFLTGEKGDICLTFGKPILVNDYINKDMPQKKIENRLKGMAWNSVMSSIPLQSTDAVALVTVYSMLGEDVRTAFSEYMGKARKILGSMPKDADDGFSDAKNLIYKDLYINSVFTNREEILDSIYGLVSMAEKNGVLLATEVSDYSIDEMTQRVYNIFSGKEKNAFVRPGEGIDKLTRHYNIFNGSIYALLMYATRAMGKIQHHMKSMES